MSYQYILDMEKRKVEKYLHGETKKLFKTPPPPPTPPQKQRKEETEGETRLEKKKQKTIGEKLEEYLKSIGMQ